MAKQFTHIELHVSGRYDPTRTRMICEAPGCTNEFTVADAFSAVAVAFALTGPDVRFSSQCAEEQHFACSPDCLRACLLDCFDNHLLPMHTARMAARTQQQQQQNGGAL